MSRRLWQRARAALRRRFAAPGPSRAALPPVPPDVAARFQFVTSAYDTEPAFLRELAATIAAQTVAGAGWVLVDNGSRRADTRRCLDELGRQPGVQLVRVAENLGILGGMRAGLEAAAADFVVPVDSDDLVAGHAIGSFGRVVAADDAARFLFSDEDHLTDGRRVNPFYRTGWDPALALACSYVWHLVAFDRREALRLGVYADPAANYCHDWDTLLRFVRAGHVPRHVREVLYSWRTHASSTTNNAADAHAGSLRSQRHVLQLHLDATGLADRFAVEDCPLWRGAPELRLRRRAAALPAVDLLVVDGAAAGDERLQQLAAEVERAVPLRNRWVSMPAEREPRGGFRRVDGDVARALAEVVPGAFGLFVCTAQATVREADWPLELIGWLELLPDADVAAGRIVDAAGRVVTAGDYPARSAVLASPDEGRDASDAGYLAMALKPRVVAGIGIGCALVRGTRLPELAHHLAGRPVTAATLGAWLVAAAAKNRRLAVCTPFVTCVTTTARARLPHGAAERHWRELAGDWPGAFQPQGAWFGATRAP